MEVFTKILNWMKTLPIWLRSVLLFLAAALGLFLTMAMSSACGSTTRATIRNMAESTSTTVSITTNNPTNWQVTPDVQLNQK